MRVLFVATGDIALPSFRHLLRDGPVPLALVTQPDKPAGRHQRLTPPAIKTEALAAGIPVFQPERIGDITGELATLAPDVIVVMAYGQILRQNILSLPRLAIINLHASLLPKYRGAACIQAAIDAGDGVSGVTSMHVVRAFDAGDIILARSIPLAPDETGTTLHDKLADLAPAVLAETLARIADGTAPRIVQDERAVSYIPKLSRDDGRIDWTQSAIAIERRIRAYHPWPGTFTMVQEGDATSRLKIFPPSTIATADLAPGQIRTINNQLIVGCGSGTALELHRLQPEGRKALDAASYLRGNQPAGFLGRDPSM